MKRLVPLALLSACSTIPDRPAPVLGGDFQVESVAGAAVPAGAAATLRFDGQRVSGQSGCNRFTAGVSHGPNTLTIGTPATTRMACPDQARIALERNMLALLPAVTTWRLQDGTLTLATPDSRTIVARRAERP